MNFLAKNSWLNFVIGLTGFYFIFSIVQIIMGRFGSRVVIAGMATVPLNKGFYWLISYGIALIVILVVLIIFCKPRAPFFVFLGILLGGFVCLYHPLINTIMSLDKDVRKDGLLALYELLPHLVVLVGALIGMYVAWLSNKLATTAE
ncbi:MAG TPA: hypothetical protein DDW50_11530 [Firmicutes bacterium]|nr:hypothetical protein [Bacillota bacterium]